MTGLDELCTNVYTPLCAYDHGSATDAVCICAHLSANGIECLMGEPHGA